MRAIITAIIILAVGFGLFWALKPQAPSNIPSAQVGDSAQPTTTPAAPAATTSPSARQANLTSFSFTGYGPGKEHVGTFKEWAVSGVSFGADGLPVTGKFTIETASVSTGIDGLDKHLCSEDFFNCAANPEIVFDLKSVAKAGDAAYSVTGNLTFNKVTKEFTFPVAAAADGKFSADFKFDTTFFNFKYVGIDKEVRIQFAGEVR
jgi:polyisoprenoid-binding protein YceI